MQQGIAPSILIVDGKPSPCECRAPQKSESRDVTKVTCAYCVQANLILWEKEEARGPKLRPSRLVNSLKKAQKTRVAEMMGVHRNTVHNILKSNKIPPKYARRFNRAIEKGVSRVRGAQNRCAFSGGKSLKSLERKLWKNLHHGVARKGHGFFSARTPDPLNPRPLWEA